MKIIDAQGLTRSSAVLAVLVVLAATVGVAGCGGSGANGPVQDGGSSGGSGPPGPVGPPDPPIVDGGPVRNFGNGSGLTAQQVKDIGALIATIDSAAVATTCSSGGACVTQPVVEFTVKTAHDGAVLGLAASALRLGVAKLVPPAVPNTMPPRWQSYINRSVNVSVNPPPAGSLPTAIQANTETGVAAGWTELGGGRYRYVATLDMTNVTSPIVVTYEPTLTHRVSIALNLSGGAVDLDPDNPFEDFVPAGGPVTTERLVAATAKCATCHVRFAEHGGSRRTVEYCDVCHNPATTDPDSGNSVDLAYMAHSIHYGPRRSQPYVVYGFNNAQFTSANVTYPQPITFCEKCHELTPTTPQGDAWQTSPEVAACGGCHFDGVNVVSYSTTTGMYTYTYTHSTDRLPPDVNTFDNGTCVGCHSAGGAAGSIFESHAKDPARKAIVNGRLFTYQILSVQNAAVGQNPTVTFRILQGGVPMDVKAITTGRLRLDFGWTTQDIHNVADIGGNQYAADRGQAIVVDLIANMASVVDNGDGTYSYTLAQALPSGFDDAVLGTGLMVVLEGRRVVDGTNAYPDSAFAFAGGTPRPQIVDPAKCNLCHEQVSAHGGSRAGNPMICTICHSPSLGGTFPANGGGTETYGPLSLGAFLHGVHSSNVEPIGEITYPQELARCEGCHVAGSFNLARPSALPMTMDAGTDLATGPAAIAWQDDLANSATAGACKGCHATAAAQTHMESQGGTFAVPKTLVPSSSQEGCAFCHGAGRTYDTKVMHCSTLPIGQCVTQ
ncbi:MAG TPA: OmcA/MtrC family decaheme c-type cytochrome [Steroidobacteraceae bacterium]|nr:OmcA/MtrC family decaheme c-type cytochrome [Steroidobacteraceae bacterium]